jgi:hypothetical protein
VVDIEAVSDHGIFASLYQVARDNNIRTILSGVNTATESILPYSWHHPKLDHVNVKSIHRKYGSIKIKTYPLMDFRIKRWVERSGLRTFHLLDYIDYRREIVEEKIKSQLNWRPYGGKHYESVFTRFYQSYILPTKFCIDKRKAHLSNLICSNQLSRNDALEQLKSPSIDLSILRDDRAFVLKKLGFSDDEFDQLMRETPKRHRDFDFEGSIFHRHPILKPLRPLWRMAKTHFSG